MLGEQELAVSKPQMVVLREPMAPGLLMAAGPLLSDLLVAALADLMAPELPEPPLPPSSAHQWLPGRLAL